MGTLAIKTDRLSKKYRIGEREGYKTLRDAVARVISKPFARDPSLKPRTRDHIWALKDVSLEIGQGEVVGIIGPNGAGKSTLLKILARITRPTSGNAQVTGRVGSLLEVGTAFHPELTGRENVFLNGAILGMSKREIERKFDEIISFAETEDFVNTPVKYYSTGMHVRLAFAVAAHLDSEVMIVDEVLAVGDYRFQKKCFEKLRHVSQTGETVLLVSHNLAAVSTLCGRAYWMDHGQLRLSGDAESTVSAYLSATRPPVKTTEIDLRSVSRPTGLGEKFTFIKVNVDTHSHDLRLRTRKPIKMELEFEVTSEVEDLVVGFSLHTLNGTWVLQCLSSQSRGPYSKLSPGIYRITAETLENYLNPGTYILSIGAREAKQGLDWVKDVMDLEIIDESTKDEWLNPVNGLLHIPARYSNPIPLAPNRTKYPVRDPA